MEHIELGLDTAELGLRIMLETLLCIYLAIRINREVRR